MPQLTLTPRDTEGSKLLDKFELLTELSPFRVNERTGLRSYSFEESRDPIEAKLAEVDEDWREHLMAVR